MRGIPELEGLLAPAPGRADLEPLQTGRGREPSKDTGGRLR